MAERRRLGTRPGDLLPGPAWEEGKEAPERGPRHGQGRVPCSVPVLPSPGHGAVSLQRGLALSSRPEPPLAA